MNEILYRASAFTIYYLVGIRPFNCSAKTVNALHKSNVKCILYFDSSNLTFNLGFARLLCPPHLLCIAFGSGFVLFTFFVFLFSRSSTFCLVFAICYLFVFVSLFFFLSILLQINLIILFDQSIQRQTNSTNKLFVCLWIYFVVIFALAMAMAMAIAMTLDWKCFGVFCLMWIAYCILYGTMCIVRIVQMRKVAIFISCVILMMMQRCRWRWRPRQRKRWW